MQPFENHAQSVKKIGKKLISQHLLSLEVLALMLFLVLIGGGMIGRFDESEKKEKK
jgi:NADH:ubiquinone oxidoreductase subunit 6 (subunit J)